MKITKRVVSIGLVLSMVVGFNINKLRTNSPLFIINPPEQQVFIDPPTH